MIRVLVVDDEPLARKELSRIILSDKGFEVAAQALSGEEALKLLKDRDFDAVFLDIEMPGISGLEVASRLAAEEEPPLVVFATAYHQYAIEAFEAHAIDYILKPFEPERIKKTLERIRKMLGEKAPQRPKLQSLETALIEKGLLKKLIGHRRGSKDRVVIHPPDVLYFHAKYAEVIAHLEGQELIVKATLRDILERLPPERFAQTHKAYVVNVDRIDKVAPLFSGNFQITLKGAKPVNLPLSRRYARPLKKILEAW